MFLEQFILPTIYSPGVHRRVELLVRVERRRRARVGVREAPRRGTHRNGLQRARSRLYRRRFLRPNTHFAAFFEIYKICNPLHRSDRKILVKNASQFWRF